MAQTGHTTRKAQAYTLKPGDFLPGLDDGYVFVEPVLSDVSGSVTVTFHTAEGDEAELTCPALMPVTIDCPDDAGHSHADFVDDDD
jgi:hypothetical protein